MLRDSAGDVIAEAPGPAVPQEGAVCFATSDDIAVLGWHGITVRVAWTLLAQGVKVRPQVLRDAREHALYHLDKAVPLSIAEDLSTQLTGQFVQRARGRWERYRAELAPVLPILAPWADKLGYTL